MRAVIHYGEIVLKGKNRPRFERQLRNNIYRSCERQGVVVSELWKEQQRFVGKFSGERTAIIAALQSVLGIENFAFVSVTERDENAIVDKAQTLLQQQSGNTMAAQVTRADKSLPFSSKYIEEIIGDMAITHNFSVNLEQPDITIHCEITDQHAYLYTTAYQGWGGLPVGISGKVLCLLSGGIDSAVAPFLPMKRGCHVDFLHVHALPHTEKLAQTKIPAILKSLNAYQYHSMLYAVLYHTYQLHTIDSMPEQYDLLAFRHFLLRLAEYIAHEHQYAAIVTGDSVGQVASQTLANLHTAGYGITLPILRPVIGWNKQDIVNMAHILGIYEHAIQSYKDCCSIISQHPATHISQERFQRFLAKQNLDAIVEESIADMNIQTYY